MERLRPKAVAASRGHTDLLLEFADLRPGLRVLDIACGTGEPALEEARRVGPTGHVTGIDPSQALVSVASEHAREEGLAHLAFETGVAEKLPFPDASVDRVTCRFGAMYFTDLAKAVSESRRVLRPGGKLAWLVWGPIEQPYFAATVFVAMRHAGIAQTPPEAAQPFRFGRGGDLARALSSGGFEDAREIPREVTWSWPGTPEEVCAIFLSGAPPFQSILDALGPESRARATEEITASLRGFQRTDHVNIPEQVIVATARRGG
ncbi:MAG: methyltransferase domain-containing protein [Thermoplasmata archaeon]|nr:methyltransferase domain-containing protein [Thermoplasmata archaeon]